MPWELIIDGSVKKQLKRIPKNYAERISNVISALAVNPYDGDIEKMEGEQDVWRRRVGDYRILYEINSAKKIIHVLDARRRTSGTY